MSEYGNQHRGTSASASDALGKPTCDSSGYAVLSCGQAGAIHVMAHRMLDSGQINRGHRLIGDWLAKRDCSGSEWVPLQWHMAVFEVSLDHWQSALARFRRHILPAVVTSHDALTGAPAPRNAELAVSSDHWLDLARSLGEDFSKRAADHERAGTRPSPQSLLFRGYPGAARWRWREL